MIKKMLIMDQADNVGVVLEDIAAQDVCRAGDIEVIALENIEFCHKIALCDLPRGTDILKYGQKIGHATVDIKQGQWLHQHNRVSERGR